MLSLRLQRAQVQLQAHRIWLGSFVASQWHLPGRFETTRPIDRAFSTTPAQRQEASTRFPKKLKNTSKSKQKRKFDDKRPAKLEVLSHRADLLEAVQEEDLKTAISLYAALPDKKPLTADDVHALAQLTSRSCRTELFKPAQSRSQDDLDEVVTFAAQLASDIQKERLMPSTHAHVHLLVTFKESDHRDSGIEFWKWLEAQDETYTNLEVYSVAIELLAISGTSLPDLEQLYQDALARFPGTFSAYHLSPDAVLPDREQPLNIKVPTVLLQAITFARLLHGDSRNAYLALDTIFRLYPTSVAPRFLQMFLKERPVSEIYTIWAMACRAGISLRTSDFRDLLAKIRTSSDLTSAVAHIATIRIMVATTYLYMGSSGALSPNSVNELIIAMTQVFRLRDIENLSTSQRKKLTDSVLSAIRKTMEVFARYGAMPTVSALNSIIANVAGFGQAEDVIRIALADMDRIKLTPNAVTRRSILTAAGQLKNAALVEETWQQIVASCSAANMSPHVTDWVVLTKAASMAGIVPFAQSQLELHQGALSDSLTTMLQSRLTEDRSEDPKTKTEASVDTTQIFDGIDKLQADLAFVEERTRDRPDGQDFSNQSIPIELIRSDYPLSMPEHEMRKLYDELTTESSSPTPSTSSTSEQKQSTTSQDSSTVPSKLSTTNISLGTLRYENWKSMNYLLWLSQKHDQEFEDMVDQAIAAGKRPPTRDLSLFKKELESLQSFGLIDGSVDSSREAVSSDSQLKKAREGILDLRQKK